MSRTYFNLTELVAAASAQNCTVHLHQDAKGQNVFSVGNSNTGAREFASYSEAMAYTSNAYTAADCAEQAGHAIGANCLDAILAGSSQADAVIQLTKALTDLQILPHPDRANAGFAAALVSVIEQGLDAAGKGD